MLAALLCCRGPSASCCVRCWSAAPLGTVLLTQRLARALQPHQGPRLSAALIALYGLTQPAAPWLTSIWMGMGGSLHSAFWLGAGALLWGCCGC